MTGKLPAYDSVNFQKSSIRDNLQFVPRHHVYRHFVLFLCFIGFTSFTVSEVNLVSKFQVFFSFHYFHDSRFDGSHWLLAKFLSVVSGVSLV